MLPRRVVRLAVSLVLSAAAFIALPVSASAEETDPVALRAIYEVQRGQSTSVTMTGYSPVGRTLTFRVEQRFLQYGSIGAPSTPVCSGNYCTSTVTYSAPAGTTAYEEALLVFVTDSTGTESFLGNYVILHATPPGGPVAHTTMTPDDLPAPGQDAFVHPTVSGPQGTPVTLSATSPAGQALTFSLDTPFDVGLSGPLAPPTCSDSVCTTTFPYYRPEPAGDQRLWFTVTDESGRTDRASMNIPFAAPAAPVVDTPDPITYHVQDVSVAVPMEFDFDGWSPTVGTITIRRDVTLCLKYGIGSCNKERYLPTEVVASASMTPGPLTLDVPNPLQEPDTDIDYVDFTADYSVRWKSTELAVDSTWPLRFAVVPDLTTIQAQPSRSRVHRGKPFTVSATVESPAARPVTGGVVLTAGRRLGLAEITAADDGSVTVRVPGKVTRQLPLGSLTVKARFSSDDYFRTAVTRFTVQVRD